MSASRGVTQLQMNRRHSEKRLGPAGLGVPSTMDAVIAADQASQAMAAIPVTHTSIAGSPGIAEGCGVHGDVGRVGGTQGLAEKPPVSPTPSSVDGTDLHKHGHDASQRRPRTKLHLLSSTERVVEVVRSLHLDQEKDGVSSVVSKEEAAHQPTGEEPTPDGTASTQLKQHQQQMPAELMLSLLETVTSYHSSVVHHVSSALTSAGGVSASTMSKTATTMPSNGPILSRDRLLESMALAKKSMLEMDAAFCAATGISSSESTALHTDYTSPAAGTGSSLTFAPSHGRHPSGSAHAFGHVRQATDDPAIGANGLSSPSFNGSEPSQRQRRTSSTETGGPANASDAHMQAQQVAADFKPLPASGSADGLRYRAAAASASAGSTSSAGQAGGRKGGITLPFTPVNRVGRTRHHASDAHSAIHASAVSAASLDNHVVLDGQPRAVLTPIWFADPPVWNTDVGPIPASLDALLLPFPAAKAKNVVAAVTVPFYSEDGFAFRRGLEALALQRSDLQRYESIVLGTAPADLPEIHVFAIADGWKKGDGASILSDSMFAELIDVFGPTLNVDELLHMLEAPPPAADGSSMAVDADGKSLLPSHVLVQFAASRPRASTTGQPDAASKRLAPSRLELAPLTLDCSWAASMRTRASVPVGHVSSEIHEVLERHQDAVGNKPAATLKQRTPSFKGAVQRGQAAGDDKHRSRTSEAHAVDGEGADESSGRLDGGSDGQWDDTIQSNSTQKIYFSLLIKRENAKKHHSHRWFFEAIAPVTRLRAGPRCEFYFATDCGTLFAPYCLAELTTHMQRNPLCAAATAHQRIMPREDQADPDSAEAEGFVAGALRSVQAFDFESGLCVFNGMHALAGFLPVVPGPCGLFRASAITVPILARVRDICTSSPETDGLVQGNLKIAEDRILSYLLVLVSPDPGNPSPGVTPKASAAIKGWETHWVPSTVFYFEAESTLKELVLQRRRWLNGTVAGYLWLLRQRALWKGASKFRLSTLAVLALSLLQVIVFGLVFLMPGLMIVTGNLAISGLSLLLSLMGLPSPLLLQALQMGYDTIAALSFIVLVYAARHGKSNFSTPVWISRLVLNSVTMAAILLSMGALLVVATVAPHRLVEVMLPGSDLSTIDPTLLAAAQSDVADARLAGYFSILYATTPFFLSLLHSPESLWMMVRTYPTYFFFLPTMLADFFAYSIGRYDDLTWGTKAVTSKKGASATSGVAERAAVRMRKQMSAITEGTGGAWDSADGAPPQQKSKRATVAARNLRIAFLRESTSRTTVMLSGFQAVACLSLAVASQALEGSLRHFLLYVGAFLSSTGLLIMMMSMLFFTQRAIFSCGSGSSSFPRRVHAFLSVAGWLTAAGCVGLLATVSDDQVDTGTEYPFTLLVAATFASVYAFLILLAATTWACRSRRVAAHKTVDAHVAHARSLSGEQPRRRAVEDV